MHLRILPLCLICILCACSAPEKTTDMGGPEKTSLTREEKMLKRMQIKREVLERQEEILRGQLAFLQREREKAGSFPSKDFENQFRESLQRLTALLRDKALAEQKMLESLHDMWDAQTHARVIGSSTLPDGEKPALVWPVEPLKGISAGYKDPSYKEHFGFEHTAIDIPIAQGSIIVSAAEGVVEEVKENGYGYSWVTIRHRGFATLYGHVTESLVAPGQVVSIGEPIARSGGMPGTLGAGHLSTGPHLHFEFITAGEHRDPMEYLSL